MKRDGIKQLLGMTGVLLAWWVPPVGVAFIFLYALGRWRHLRIRRMANTLAPVIVLGVVMTLLGRPQDAAQLVGLGMLLVFVPQAVGFPRRVVTMAVLASLVVLTVLAAYITYIDVAQWQPVTASDIPLAAISPFGSQLIQSKPNFRVAVFRGWTVAGVLAEPKAFTVTLRRVGGTPGFEWRTGSDEFAVQQDHGDGSENGVTTLHFDGDHGFVFRRAPTGGPLSGRGFHASIEMRSVDRDNDCGTAYLGQPGVRNGTRTPVCLGATWRRTDLSWNAQDGEMQELLELNLHGFAGQVQTRKVSFSEWTDHGRVDLGQGTPTGVALRIAWGTPYPWAAAGENEVIATTIPSTDLTALRVELPSGIPQGTRVWTALHLEDGLDIEVVRESWDSPGLILPSRSRSRLELWTGHPNILGHTVAAIGVSGVVVALALRVQIAIVGLTLALVATTGSRTAMVAVLVAVVIQLSARRLQRLRIPASQTHGSQRTRWRSVTATVAIAAGIAVLTAASVLGRVDSLGSATGTRVEIWRHAVTWIAQGPCLGAVETFASSWSGADSDQSPVSHPHNGLLLVLGQFGAIGALALAYGVFAMSRACMERSRTATVTVLTTLFTLNLTDATIMHAAVGLPLMLALAAVDASSDRE